MMNLSDNYYKRKCFFKQEQVPTQSVMRKTMSPPLAKVYFKSMTPKLRALAGLEPLLKGGGNDWFIPPKELLEGRAVMKPMHKEYLSKLGFNGIAHLGEHILETHYQNMEKEKVKTVLENDINWKKNIDEVCCQQWKDDSAQAARQNTQKILLTFDQFYSVCSTSISNLQDLMFDASIKEIKRIKKESFEKMLERYVMLVKQQATRLYDKYTEQLMAEKAKLKAEFIRKLEEARARMGDELHDINYEKHLAAEKLRSFLQCQKLACQIYVALKEREECEKELDLSKRKHEKQVKVLKEEITMKDFEITLTKKRENKRQELHTIWQKKVCEVMRKFQMFVGYSLSSLPEHAEFFVNMEKLMMLQLNEAFENPHADNVFVPETDEFHTPVPRPHPFFLFCDKGFKPNLNQNLSPEHCTSSASQLPVIIVNKKCIYAACDNFEMFTDKVTQYLHGQRGDDKDFEDEHEYTFDIPVKFTRSQQLQELKLESSLFQILQAEVPNIRNIPTECCVCKIPYCFCSPLDATKMPSEPENSRKSLSLASAYSGEEMTRHFELVHEREPNWDSYLKYVIPKKCKCSKMARKHLEEHVPFYMRQKSAFFPPYLPNYEPCSVAALKRIVKKAQGKRTPPLEPALTPPRTRDAGTQYTEPDFEFLCTCFSDEMVDNFLTTKLITESRMFDTSEAPCDLVTGSVTPSYMAKTDSSFATERALSLKRLMDASPELEVIFRKTNCIYE